VYGVGDGLRFDVKVLGEKLVDLYVGVIFPDSSYYTIVYPLIFSEVNVLQAYKTGIQLVGDESYGILSLDLPALAVGSYQVCGLLTVAGSNPYDVGSWLSFDCRGFLFQ